MFDIVDLPKDPRVARRLVEMAELGGLDLSPEIYELANKDRDYRIALRKLPFSLTEAETNTVDFIRDRKGRCVVLEGPISAANRSSLSYVWLTNEFPVLIITNVLTQHKWLSLISKLWPNKTVNIFGKSKFQPSDLEASDAAILKNVHISVRSEEGFDFYISKPSEVYKGELLKKHRLAQVIVNHVADVGSVTKATLSHIEHLCIETAASMIFVNLHQCVASAKVTNPSGLDQIHWSSYNLAIRTSSQILYPNMTFDPYMAGEYEHLDNHLEENGVTLDRSKWLPIMNICPHLVR